MTAIFAAKMNLLALFIVSSISMTAMHTISTLIGASFPYLLSASVTSIITVILFFGFGLHMIYKASSADEDSNEEEEEVQKAIDDRETKERQ